MGGQSHGLGRPASRAEHRAGKTLGPQSLVPPCPPGPSSWEGAETGAGAVLSPPSPPPLPFPVVYRTAELDPVPFALKSHPALEIYCILIKLPEWETYENIIFVFYYVINLA